MAHSSEQARKRERREKRKRKEAKERYEALSDRERRTLRRSGCEGKLRHASGHEANQQVSRLFEKRGFRLVAYPCLFCDGWHLGRDWRGGREDEPAPLPDDDDKE